MPGTAFPKSVTEFWHDYLQELATERAKVDQEDPTADPAAMEAEKAAQPELSPPKEPAADPCRFGVPHFCPGWIYGWKKPEQHGRRIMTHYMCQDRKSK